MIKMKNNTIGEIIRDLRKRHELSQEELAEGICSVVSVSRIENGTQMPSQTILEKLLQRLGTGTYEICNIFYKNEKQQVFEETAEKVFSLISQGNLSTAEEELLRIKEEAKEEEHNWQYYILLEVSIEIHRNNISEQLLETLHKALRLTKPRLDYSELRHELLTIREANILSIIVVLYFKLDRVVEAIKLGEELMKSLAAHKSVLREYQIIKINLAINLAQCMEKEGRYGEALDYACKAEEISFTATQHILLPEIQFIKAKIHHLKGEDELCISILKAVVPYMELIKKKSFADLVRGYAREEFDLRI